jgi:hypothetical protein
LVRRIESWLRNLTEKRIWNRAGHITWCKRAIAILRPSASSVSTPLSRGRTSLTNWLTGEEKIADWWTDEGAQKCRDLMSKGIHFSELHQDSENIQWISRNRKVWPPNWVWT